METMNNKLIGSKSFFIVLLVLIIGCSDGGPLANEDSNSPVDVNDSDYTGNEAEYQLISASDFDMSGTVTLKERKDASADVVIQLNGVTGTSAQFPVHLHLGDISQEDASVAAWLNPVADDTGISKTNLKYMADESAINFQELKNLNACIKIHLPYGQGVNVVVAAGNIGTAKSKADASGRVSIAICRGS